MLPVKQIYTIILSITIISSLLLIRSHLTTINNNKLNTTIQNISDSTMSLLTNNSDIPFGNGNLSLGVGDQFISLLNNADLTDKDPLADLDYSYDEQDLSWLYADDGNNSNSGSQLKIIYFLGLFELTTKFGVRNEAASEVAAAQLAIKQVNKLQLLSGYELKLLVNDTKCDPGVAIDRFFYSLYSNLTISMLLGSGCSNVTESLASIVPYWNILQVSYGATSPALSDRVKFPMFFRTVAPDSSHNGARLAFIRHFGWRTAATFSQGEDSYLLPVVALVRELEGTGVRCTGMITFTGGDFREKLRMLKKLDTRIIIGSFSPAFAAKIFCVVFELEMYGADYVWILRDQQRYWWHKYDLQACESGSIRRASEGVIFIADSDAVVGHTETSVSGLTNELFKKELSNITSWSKYAKHTYDAIWAMATSLKLSMDICNITTFDYHQRNFAETIKEQFESLKFMGISGPVQFHGSDRVGISIFKQIQGGTLTPIAIYHPSTPTTLHFNCAQCSPIHWQGSGDNRIPISQRVLLTHLVTVPRWAFYTILTVSLAGVAACLLFLGLNLHYRRLRTVKLSSPRLNNVAVVGCVVVYAGVVLYGVDSTMVWGGWWYESGHLCTARVYLLSAGFSLAFGSTFAKTYRVHRIFTYSGCSLRNKILRDKQLIILIFLLLLIDAVIVMCWMIVDPLQKHLHNLALLISAEDRGVLYQPQIEYCRSNNNTAGWFTALCGYKVFLLIMGVYMAWATRHIKVQALNDAQYIGISVYSTMATSIVLLLTNFLTQYTLLSYLARTTSILFTTTLTLSLLFLSKLKPVLTGSTHSGVEDTQVVESMGLKVECNTIRFVASDPREMLYRMEVQNKVYRCEVEALDREIARLEGLLAETSSSSGDLLSMTTQHNNKNPALTLTRASWPSTRLSAPLEGVRCLYHSENRLSSSRSFLAKVRRLLGNIGLRGRNRDVEELSDVFEEYFERARCDVDDGGGGRERGRGGFRRVSVGGGNDEIFVITGGDLLEDDEDE